MQIELTYNEIGVIASAAFVRASKLKREMEFYKNHRPSYPEEFNEDGTWVCESLIEIWEVIDKKMTEAQKELDSKQLKV